MIIKILIVIICYFSKFSNTFFEKKTVRRLQDTIIYS